MQEIPEFGGGASQTIIHPIVMVGMAVAVVLILTLPRKKIIVPFLFSFFLIPLGQQIYLGGVHWFVSRIIILFGLMRLIIEAASSSESTLSGGFNSIDGAFLGVVLTEASCVLIRSGSAGLVNQIGFILDFVGAYFLLRWMIRDNEDILRAIKCFAFLAGVLGIAMVYEQYTMRNIFGYLGGQRLVPEVRDGRIRSQGVFLHTLTAGTCGATLLSLVVILWKKGSSKLLAAFGFVGCTLMTITSNSSTPLLAYAAGVFAICMWSLRKKMRIIRYGIVFGLIGLNAVMKAPVWFVIMHIDLTGSSGGYHRAELIDQFIRHFFDWWLIGTLDTANWGYDIWDAQNQFVQIGETGGLIAFILFVAIVSLCFRRIGHTRKFAESPGEEWTLWLLGCALFANCVGFFGVNYFDQSRVSWFTLLAMICAATAPILKLHPLRKEIPTLSLQRSLQIPQPAGSPILPATRNLSAKGSRNPG